MKVPIYLKDWVSVHSIFIRKVTIFLALVIPVFIILFPVLIRGEFFLQGDALSYTYPSGWFYQQHSGSHWNPYIALGVPFDATAHSGFLSPVYRFFYAIFPFFFAYHSIIFFNLLLTSLFSFLFARKIGLQTLAAVLVAYIATFSQWNILWLSNLNVINVTPLVPILFFFICKINEGDSKYYAGISIVVSLITLYGHTQLVIMGLFASVLFFLYVTYIDKEKVPAHRFRSTIIFFTAIGIGLLFTLPLLTKIVSSSDQSLRYSQVDVGWYLGETGTIFDLVKYLLPWFGLPYIGGYLLPYIGIPTILLAIFFLVYIRRFKYATFFTAGFYICVSLSIFPLISKLLYFLPVFDHFRGPARWMFIGNFFIAVIVGMGFHTVLGGMHKRQFDVFNKLLIKIGLLFFNIIILLSIFYTLFSKYILNFLYRIFDTYLYKNTQHLSLDFYYQIISRHVSYIFENISINSPQVILLFLIFGATVLLFNFIYNKTVQRLLILLCVVNLALVLWPQTETVPANLIMKQSVVDQFINTHDNSDRYSYRIAHFMIENSFKTEPISIGPSLSSAYASFFCQVLLPNCNIVQDRLIVAGYEPTMSSRVDTLLKNIFPTYDLLPPVPEKIASFVQRIPVVSMLATKYIVSSEVLSSVSLVLRNVFPATESTRSFYLYENKSFLPRVYLPQRVIVREAVSPDLLVTNSDTQIAFIECSASCPNQVSSNPGIHTLQKVIYTDDSVSLETELLYPQWLIFSEAHLPGRHAYIDGIETKIYLANYALQGIFVPAGVHRIIFNYK